MALGYPMLKMSTELLKYAKNTLENIPPFLEEENITQWLECTDEAPVIQCLKDQEIINSVLKQQDLNLGMESYGKEIKVTHERGLSSRYEYFKFLQNRIIFLNRIY